MIGDENCKCYEHHDCDCYCHDWCDCIHEEYYNWYSEWDIVWEADFQIVDQNELDEMKNQWNILTIILQVIIILKILKDFKTFFVSKIKGLIVPYFFLCLILLFFHDIIFYTYNGITPEQIANHLIGILIGFRNTKFYCSKSLCIVS